jgi:hypothetical protein
MALVHSLTSEPGGFGGSATDTIGVEQFVIEFERREWIGTLRRAPMRMPPLKTLQSGVERRECGKPHRKEPCPAQDVQKSNWPADTNTADEPKYSDGHGKKEEHDTKIFFFVVITVIRQFHHGIHSSNGKPVTG